MKIPPPKIRRKETQWGEFDIFKARKKLCHRYAHDYGILVPPLMLVHLKVSSRGYDRKNAIQIETPNGQRNTRFILKCCSSSQ